MRFGMGIVLTDEEERLIGPIAKPCFAALGLANDFYSFDIEWDEFRQTENEKDYGDEITFHKTNLTPDTSPQQRE